MDGIDEELESEVLRRVVLRTVRNLGAEINGKPETYYEPELAEAMQLTGGYVQWLRENASAILPEIEVPPQAMQQCALYGRFTAYMRARPSSRQEEAAEREFATRLTAQLMRLAGHIALVLNRQEIDSRVMQRVRRVALDTSRGVTLALVGQLCKHADGLRTDSLAMLVNRTADQTRKLLHFLGQIGAVECRTAKGRTSRWYVREKLRGLYEEVMRA